MPWARRGKAQPLARDEQLARELDAACAIGVKDATQQLHDGPSTHNNTTGGRSRAAPRRVPARKGVWQVCWGASGG